MRDTIRQLTSRRSLLIGAILVIGAVQFAPWTSSADRAPIVDQSDCAIWDRAASEGIAPLLSDASAAAALRLDEAILQLRRARKSCRTGALALARHDYVSLHKSFPAVTGSIRTADQDAR